MVGRRPSGASRELVYPVRRNIGFDDCVIVLDARNVGSRVEYVRRCCHAVGEWKGR
jgi:hypothetical protein